MATVSFYSTTAAKYAALSAKNPDALYFLDNGQLYKGSTLIGNNTVLVETDFPATGVEGLIYVKPTNGEVKIWNGSAYVNIVREYTQTISQSSTDNQTPTAGAVYRLVKASVPSDYSDLKDQVETNKNDIAAINNTTTGILAQAKAYTDGLRNGQVATNKTDIANLKSGKADKATTLAGYGITDAMTATQIQAAIANAGHLKREVVDALPAVASADANTIYMVPKASGTGNQKYDEYMLINGAFEKIGDTEVDLTNYATKNEVATAKNEAISDAAADATTKANTAKSEAISAAATALDNYKKENDPKVTKNTNDIAAINNATTGILAQAKSYANSLSSNYATAAQGTKADSALQQADITTGTTNGTISVKGANVSVKGLGSAAYTASSAYDAAGAANTALANAKSYTDGLLSWKTL